MDSKSNGNPNQNSKPVSKVRPKSSIFPPLVQRSAEQQNNRRSRSSSFDYSFSDKTFDLYSDKSTNSQTNVLKPNDTLNKQTQSEIVHATSSSTIPVLPKSPSDECQRLKTENQILKNNFLRMSRIIQKHSRLMAKKDEIILKLQEKNYRNNLPVIQNESKNVCLLQNEHDTPLSYANVSNYNSAEIQAKNSEFSMKFRQIYDSMIVNFSQHLTQFSGVIDDMQKFLENNLKVIERRNSNNLENINDSEKRLMVLNSDYSELKNKYELLMKQNNEFKSFIQFVINLCNTGSVYDFTSSESIASLRQHFSELLSKNQTLSDEIESIQKCRKSEEDYCFWLIECLSDLELELELLGRSPQTLGKVIEKLDLKLESIQQNISQTYLQSLNKTLLQIYKNHLKWFQFVNKPSKSTQTWNQTPIEDSSTEDEEIASVSHRVNADHKLESSTSDDVQNVISEEIKSKFDELSDEMSFNDFDIESINYILMAKHFDYNLKSNLEVVEEVEEENLEDEEEESESDTLSYSDNVFEDVEECSDTCLKTSQNVNENCVKNECKLDYIENIESVVEEVLNDILDKISVQFVHNMPQMSFNNPNINSPCTSRCEQPYIDNDHDHNDDDVHSPNIVEVKPHNIDSDFVSDDLSSSPETVMTYHQDQLNRTSPGPEYNSSSTGSEFMTTFTELKQLKSKQTQELVLAKTRIKDFETIMSEDKDTTNGRKQQSKENQYLSDELNAWKELVEQQKAIMEKIRAELELQQELNAEKDRTIESLKSQSKSESLAEISESQPSIHQIFDKSDAISDDECKTVTDELDLNNLFDADSESEVEVIDVNQNGHQINPFLTSDHNKNGDILIKEVWNKPSDSLDVNYVSDESSGYSVYTDKSSPLSVPEELLLTNRKKVFIPFSHEDAAVRRHSCQGRLIHYGSHPRKKRLELKNAEIVFQMPKVAKELRHRTKQANGKK